MRVHTRAPAQWNHKNKLISLLFMAVVHSTVLPGSCHAQSCSTLQLIGALTPVLPQLNSCQSSISGGLSASGFENCSNPCFEALRTLSSQLASEHCESLLLPIFVYFSSVTCKFSRNNVVVKHSHTYMKCCIEYCCNRSVWFLSSPWKQSVALSIFYAYTAMFMSLKRLFLLNVVSIINPKMMPSKI